MKDGKQKCWLSWSEKMYPRGIDLSLEPADVGELAKVETVDGTMVEICWTEKIKSTGERGARLVLTQADGDGSEDVYVKGEFLDKTVKGEVGGATRRKPVQRNVASNDNDNDNDNRGVEAAAAGVAGAAAGIAAVKGSSNDSASLSKATDSKTKEVSDRFEYSGPCERC